MHVALLANTAWLDEELVSFRHLVVGLIDEQVRVAQVVPQYLPLEESSVFGERILWQESRWSMLNRYRLTQLSGPLEELEIDLIHALDGRLWAGAVPLAEAMEVPAILNANSHLDLKLVTRLARSLDPARVAFTATTGPLVQAVRDRLDPAFTVELIPPGAHANLPLHTPTPGDALCAVVSGRGQLDAKYQALLEGMVMFVQEHPHTQFFFDGQGSDQHLIWQAARKLGLLANLSMIPRRLGHREMLVRADVLLQPQPAGRSRGLILQAMAHGVPVIAHDDPWLDYLIDGETSWIVHDPTPIAWYNQLSRYVAHPEAAQELGRRAQAWIGKHRLASQRIAHILDLYRRITGEAIKFPGE